MSLLSRLYDIQYWTRIHCAGAWRRLQHHTMPPQHFPVPTNVLFVVSGLIGDSVMCTPVLIEARRLWPKARITVLGKKHNCELLTGLAVVDQLLVTPAIPFSLRKRRVLRELDVLLAAGEFDTAIILLGDEFAPTLERANIATRVGVAGHPLAPFLTHAYEIGSPRVWGPDERLNALRVLGCEVHSLRPVLRTNEEAKLSARKLRQQCGAKSDRYAVVHPFGSSARQHWPMESVVALSDALALENLEPVLVGGPEFRSLSERSLEKRHTPLVNTVGRSTLPELAAILDGAALVITTDSGPFHLAGALKRPIVGLFRKSRPEHAARYSCSRVLLGTAPVCERRCRWDWCHATPCASMQALNVSDVMGEVRSILTVDQGATHPNH